MVLKENFRISPSDLFVVLLYSFLLFSIFQSRVRIVVEYVKINTAPEGNKIHVCNKKIQNHFYHFSCQNMIFYNLQLSIKFKQIDHKIKPG